MRDRESYPLLSVEQALERILATVHPLEPESIPILEALGRVLAEDVSSDTDVPPLDNSAMDGYAVQGGALDNAVGPIRLRIVGEVVAGQMPERCVGEGEAVRIMTGAPIPQGADTVVRFEDTAREGEWVVIHRVPRVGANVRSAGEDVRCGEIVLTAGTPLRAQEIGMLASVGRERARVLRRPRVAILATGDEVVEIREPAGAGKIRNINSYSNAAQVLAAGGEPVLLGVARDRAGELSDALRRGLDAGADLFITSGGVSVGDFDLVKNVLSSEGSMDFWWVNMKPGKPMAFGRLERVPLLALPGNPVSAMISFGLFARPAIRKMLGHTQWEWPSTMARLADPIARKDGRRHYLRVRLQEAPGGLLEARLTGDQGSGILASMVQADGLAVIPEDCGRLEAGSLVQVLLLN